MRKLNSLKNFITSTVPFIILIVLGFWKINVWQGSLDEDIYALNQLFFQIFAYLSLAEAGIGALVQKEYYKLFANEDRETIRIYYTLSKRMLRNVCYIIGALGLVLSFFLPMLANDNDLSLWYMQKIFILFLVKSLVEYFMFSPRFVLQADQKLYKINVQMNLYKIAECILETLLILYGVPFEFVLIITFLLRVVMNWHVNCIIYKEYPWLKPVSDTKGIKIRGMQHVLAYKVVSVVYENADLILISAYINPISVIIYSNYKYITKYVTDLLHMVGNSLSSSLGNLLYAEDRDKSFDTYEMINTMFYFVASFLTIALGYCMNSFISLWVGSDKIFDMVSFACILYLFFHNVARKPQYILKDIFALYKELQLVSIIEAVMNLALSFALVHSLGIRGVLIATVISRLLTNFWYFPYFLYKFTFNKKMWVDIAKYIVSLMCIAGLLWISNIFLPRIPSDNYIVWFLGSCAYCLGVLVILAGFYSLFFKSFRNLLRQCAEMLVGILKKQRKRSF